MTIGGQVQRLLKCLTEAIDCLESDVTGIYDTKLPYGSCGSEWVIKNAIIWMPGCRDFFTSWHVRQIMDSYTHILKFFMQRIFYGQETWLFSNWMVPVIVIKKTTEYSGCYFTQIKVRTQGCLKAIFDMLSLRKNVTHRMKIGCFAHYSNSILLLLYFLQ